MRNVWKLMRLLKLNYSSINSYSDQALDEEKANSFINGDLNLGYRELEKKTEANAVKSATRSV